MLGVDASGTRNTTDEIIQDVVGAMFSSNTETGITATYQDDDGTIDLVVGTLNQDTTGNAATATTLQTARTIAGVSFNGSGNINIPLTGLSDTPSSLGSCWTDTKSKCSGHALEFSDADSVTVNNSTTDTDFPVVFHNNSNGLLDNSKLKYNPSTGDLTKDGGNLVINDGQGFLSLTITEFGNILTSKKIGTATNQEYIDFSTSNEINVKVNNTERLSVTSSGVDITGNLSVSGSYGLSSSDIPNNAADTTGNAATATSISGIENSNIVQLTSTQTLTNKTLTSPIISSISNTGTLTLPTSTDTLIGRNTTDTLTNKTLNSPTITGTGTIAGVFTGDITGDVTGNADTATTATNVTVTANNSTNETVYLTFVDGATGSQGIESDTGLTYNPSSGVLTTTSVSGNLTGNVTGNTSGSSGSCTGNSATATTATNVTVTANNSTNETVYLLL